MPFNILHLLLLLIASMRNKGIIMCVQYHFCIHHHSCSQVDFHDDATPVPCFTDILSHLNSPSYSSNWCSPVYCYLNVQPMLLLLHAGTALYPHKCDCHSLKTKQEDAIQFSMHVSANTIRPVMKRN
jgi:hypothetical protein